MANEYSILRQIPPPQQVADVDLQFKALTYKQKKFDEGFEDFKTQFNAVANLDIARESGQNYLKQRLAAISNQLGGNVYDFSDSSVSTGLIGSIGQTFDDTVVQEIIDTKKLRKAQKEIAEIKEANDGRYSEINHAYAMRGVKGWMKSAEVTTRLGDINYTNYVDIPKEMKEYYDSVFDNSSQTVDIPITVDVLDKDGKKVLNEDGTVRQERTGEIRRVKKSGLTPAEISSLYVNIKTPSQKQQEKINAWATFGQDDPAAVNTDYETYMEGRVKQLNDRQLAAANRGNIGASDEYIGMLNRLVKQNERIESVTNPKDKARLQGEFLVEQGNIGAFENQYRQRVTEQIRKKDEWFYAQLDRTDKRFDRRVKEEELKLKIRKQNLEETKAGVGQTGASGVNPDGVSSGINPDATKNELNGKQISKVFDDAYIKNKNILDVQIKSLYDQLTEDEKSKIDDIVATNPSGNPTIAKMQAIDWMRGAGKGEGGGLSVSETSDVLGGYKIAKANFENSSNGQQTVNKAESVAFGERALKAAKDVIGAQSSGNPNLPNFLSGRNDNQIIRDKLNRASSQFGATFKLVGDKKELVDNEINSDNIERYFRDNPKEEKIFKEVALMDVAINADIRSKVGQNLSGDDVDKSEMAINALAESRGVEAPKRVRGGGSFLPLVGLFETRSVVFEGGNESLRNDLNNMVKVLHDDSFENAFRDESLLNDNGFRNELGGFKESMDESLKPFVRTLKGSPVITIQPSEVSKGSTTAQNEGLTLIQKALAQPTVTQIRVGEGFVPINDGGEDIEKRLKSLDSRTQQDIKGTRLVFEKAGESFTDVTIGTTTLRVNQQLAEQTLNNFGKTLNFSNESTQLLLPQKYTTSVSTLTQTKVVKDRNRLLSKGFTQSDLSKISPTQATKHIVTRYKNQMDDSDRQSVELILNNASLFGVEINQSVEDGVTVTINGENGFEYHNIIQEPVNSWSDLSATYNLAINKATFAPSLFITRMVDEIVQQSIAQDEDISPQVSLNDLKNYVLSFQK